ncbi:tim44-like domain protein [Anaplasma phagocytophilum str. ApMUC09]|nr:tim44-like domain protein [Anaplasma phagocytophilum str. ApMUC09]
MWIGMVELAIYAFVAAFIFFRLYSSLGRASSINFQGACATPEKPGDDRVALDAKNDQQDIPLTSVTEEEHFEEVSPGIEVMRARSIDFSLRNFMAGSAAAFEVIMKALNRGDTELLSSLLSDDIYKSFEKEIMRRNSEGHIHEDVVVSIVSQKITAAKVIGDVAAITVKFLTEQINVVRNAAGDVIAGSTSKINVVEDFWTFEKNANSPSRKWYLSATC